MNDTSDLRYQVDIWDRGGEFQFDVRVIRTREYPSAGIRIAESMFAESREAAVAQAQKIAGMHRREVADGRAAFETVDLT